MKCFYFILFLSLLTISNAFSQLSVAPCNQNSPLISNTYSDVTATAENNLLGNSKFSNVGNLTDSDLDNSADWTAVLAGSAWIEVKDNNATGNNEFPSGTYAGFVIEKLNLAGLGARLTIETYSGSTLQESRSDLQAVSVLNGSKQTYGFITSKPFDRIRITVNAGLTLAFTLKVYYAQILRACSPPELLCNTTTPLIQADQDNSTEGHGVIVVPSRSGITGISTGIFQNPENVVDADPGNYLEVGGLDVSLLSTTNISVRDIDETFPAGLFAGYRIENDELAAVDLLGISQIKTYLNGTLQETSVTDKLIAKVGVLSGNEIWDIGFVTTLPFDEIQYTIAKPANIDLGTTKIYHAVVKKYCSGDELECNTETTLSGSEYPVEINGSRTGFEGVACIGCSVNNANNAIDDDPDTFASITFPVSVASTAGFSVKNELDPFPANTYASFNISNPNLLSTDLLNVTTIELYKNNSIVQTGTGSAQLIFTGSTLLGEHPVEKIGIVSTTEFDEVRLVMKSTVGLDLGTTLVFGVSVLKGCAAELTCTTTAPMVRPGYSMVIEGSRTGIGSGVACVGCAVNAPDKAIDADLNDPATIQLAAGAVGSNGSISVRDLSLVYPKGTIGGFVVRDPNPVLQVGLLSAIRISTYLNGSLQESRSGAGQLIDLNAVLPLLGSGSQLRAIGFAATLPFNEIQITYTTLLNSVNLLNVYYPFIDARFADDPAFNCNVLIPIHAKDDINQIPQKHPATGNVLTNDQGSKLKVAGGAYLDADGNLQPLIVGVTTTIYQEDGTIAGEISLEEDGSYIFDPAENLTGKVQISYTAQDEFGFTDNANLVINIIPVSDSKANDAPIANNDNVVGNINSPIDGNALSNDSDPDDDVLTVTQIEIDGTTYPLNTTEETTVTIPSGTISVNSDGDFYFSPSQDFVGKVPPITYTVCDNGSPVACNFADINITFIESDDGANTTFGNDDAQAAPRGVTLQGNVLDNDFDPEGDLQTVTNIQVNGVDYPINSINPTEVAVSDTGSLTIGGDGNYTFIPEETFVGTFVVVYTVCDDGAVQACDKATLYLTELGTENALPITLNSFGAFAQNCFVVLNWTTETEENFSHFVIERSTDALSFKEIETVVSKGNNQKYSYTDKNTEAAINYYRLKLVDLDNKFSYSNVVHVKTDCSSSKIEIYPNPTDNFVTISGLHSGDKVTVVDSQGKTVLTKEYQGKNIRMQMAGFAKGIYYLSISNKNGRIVNTQSILKK